MFIFSFLAFFVDELRRHHLRLRAGLDSLAASKGLVLILALVLVLLLVLVLVLVSVSVLVLGLKLLSVLELAGFF